MAKPRPCGCKGIRTCLICETNFGMLKKEFVVERKAQDTYVYCPWCNKAWPGWDLNDYKEHPNHKGSPIDYPGVFIMLDFLSAEEEERLMKGIDEMPWDPSQSGRRKQNFGPKCNFKKKKVKPGDFHGFPAFSKFVQEKFTSVPILEGYKTVEQCTLEYTAERGASIDPHIDDCWIWGERIVTVNLTADCVLTMTKYEGDEKRYNLLDIKSYPPVLDANGHVIESTISRSASGDIPQRTSPISEAENAENYMENKENCDMNCPIIRIPMPNRSLLVIYGAARYSWEHSVLREDVRQRRLCLAYRELTPPYLESGDHWEIGKAILEKSAKFWDHLQTSDL